ncbi:MAG: DeoR family transcriptional regulator, partial [Ancrocorticia populi]
MVRPDQLSGRSRQIIDIVTDQGPVRVEELARLLDVSVVTAYRDLAKLEQLELVTRSKGEISPARSSQSEMPTSLRSKLNAPEKNEIAAAASQLVTRGESIIVD